MTLHKNQKRQKRLLHPLPRPSKLRTSPSPRRLHNRRRRPSPMLPSQKKLPLPLAQLLLLSVPLLLLV